jgi:flagellar biosynthesis/type III secretory pathway M-ring protein FliF/YscJ
VLAVENMSFQQPEPETTPTVTKVERVRTALSQWSNLLRYAAVALLFLAVYLTMLRPVKKQLITAFKELPGRMAARANSALLSEGEKVPGLTAGEASEGQRMLGLKRQLADKVKSEPVGASKLVQSWIREGAGS